MTPRVGAATFALLGALLVGGVSQAFLWRWGFEGLASVTDSQFMWVLLIYGVSWGWSGGRIGPGVAAGGLTGLAIITSYYLGQWVADGPHSATSQFSSTGGVPWSLAAIGGGAVLGLFGALSGMDVRRKPRVKAVGITTPAVIVAAGPPLWLLVNGQYLDGSGLAPAVAFFVLVGVGLFVAAVRTCGPIASLQALALSVGLGGVALAGLWFLQTHGWLYLTF